MKILFSTSFDSGYYLDYSLPENKYLFNVKICGPQGLLEVLERMTGNSGNYPGTLERRLLYCDILDSFFQKNKTIFNDSYINDPVGVAGELLRYRDQLTMVGWGKDVPDITLKIDTLREIEKEAEVPPGPCDRFRKVLECIPDEQINIDISKIDIHENREDIHPFYNDLFEVLSERGVDIVYHNLPESWDDSTPLSAIKNLVLGKEKQVELNPNLNNFFQIIRFRSEIEAAHFFAGQYPFSSDSVIIQTENRLFSSVVGSYGLPIPAVREPNVNSGIIQLFKLAASLFTEPVNIHNYMAYLQVPLHPVSKSLRYAILDHIANQGGGDENEFRSIVEGFVFVDEKDRKLQELFLIPGNSKNGEVVVDTVGKFYNLLAAWARKRVFRDENADKTTRKQLNHLRQLCDFLLRALQNYSEKEILQDALLKMIHDIYEPVDIQLNITEKGSVNMVSSPGQLISNTRLTIWLDFYNNAISPRWYDFLSTIEKTRIDPEDKLLWKPERQAASMLNKCKRTFLKSNEKICLVVAEKTGDNDTAEHPFHSFLKAKISNLDFFTISYSEDPTSVLHGWEIPEIRIETKIILPEKKHLHKISRGDLIKPRSTESYSSTELLINHPFDWTFQYPLMIKQGYTYELDEVETTMGNVAHYFINLLLNECNNDISMILARLDNSYEMDLRNTVTGYGAILLLPENSFEYTRLKQRLADSFRTLLDIIRLNQLRIVGSEKEFTYALVAQGNQEYTGDVDMLLETADGKKVIIDLKWTRKVNRYTRKLQESKAVQLALYQELVSLATGTPVKKTAYFLLSNGLLVSAYPFQSNGAFIRIKAEENDINVADKVHNSMKYRMGQLLAGNIENGENQLKGNIMYASDTGHESRIELDFDNKDMQKENYYSRFRVFKGNHS